MIERRKHRLIKSSCAGALLLILCSSELCAQIYVSPTGNDSASGTINDPYRTIQRAIGVVTAGGLIYLRDGMYPNSTTIRPNRSGLSGQLIRLWAYPGETPIVDFSQQPTSSSSRGIYISQHCWHLKGLTVRYAGDNGIYITGDTNIVENCTTYGNEDTGVQISGGGSYNLILNCDSYANYDSLTHGENADGFAPKLDIGPGNVLRGCRAWANSDDGYDLYEGQNPVVIDSCWAFHNGYNIWGDPSFQGDGNGFKVGGNYVPAQHIVTRSIAFDNLQKGFDQNHNTAGVTVYNCTGWRNNRNFVFNEAPTAGQHVLKNNISWQALDQIIASTVQEANSWQGFTVTAADFVSIDTSLARAPRDSAGNLPETGFLRLTVGSDLVDSGVNVGLPFNGIAPDLGAFESEAPNDVAYADSEPGMFALRQNYPNPFNQLTVISYELSVDAYVTLKVYDMLGEVVRTLVSETKKAGVHRVGFNAENLPSGVYLYTLRSGTNKETRKLELIK